MQGKKYAIINNKMHKHLHTHHFLLFQGLDQTLTYRTLWFFQSLTTFKFAGIFIRNFHCLYRPMFRMNATDRLSVLSGHLQKSTQSREIDVIILEFQHISILITMTFKIFKNYERNCILHFEFPLISLFYFHFPIFTIS